jgi:adenosylcobinamide-GDP ribazoletransferase
LTQIIKSFFAALAFLTIVPVPDFLCGTEDDLSRSLPWFVVVGTIIGLVIALIDKVFCHFLPVLPASALTVLLLTAASGGLHMDGLADTADGFFSSRPRDRVLEIMRDSRIGAMGVIAIVAVMLVKFTLVTSLYGSTRYIAVFLMPVAGRFAPVFTTVTMKYVHGDAGLGTVFKSKASFLPLSISLLLFLGICFGIARYYGLIVALVTILYVAIFSIWCNRKIGGWTGDTLGASVEISETIPPIVLLLMAHVGFVI